MRIFFSLAVSSLPDTHSRIQNRHMRKFLSSPSPQLLSYYWLLKNYRVVRLISYEGVKLIKKKFVVIMSVKLEVTEMRFSLILYKNNIQ